MTANRLERIADTLRSMAAKPTSHDMEKLLALAYEIDQVRKDLSFADFAHGIFSQYTPRPRPRA